MLYLLSACQKYDMDSILSFIREEVNRGVFPAPKGVETFFAYAIAGAEGLIPEMEKAARESLDHPMTFDNLGEGLRLFEGWALRDLARFRKQCRDNFITSLDQFIGVKLSEPSSIWVGCPEVMPPRDPGQRVFIPPRRVLPTWLNQVFSRNLNELKLLKFTQPLDNIQEYVRSTSQPSRVMRPAVFAWGCTQGKVRDSARSWRTSWHMHGIR